MKQNAYISVFKPKPVVETHANFNKDSHGSHCKIVGLVGQNKKVLDVGCATGVVSKHLKEKGCYVVGIEINGEAAEVAEQYLDLVIQGDAETVVLDKKFLNFFDIIVFGDILEHLKYPDEVLARYRNYLNNNGFIIASLPNFGYWRARMKCLLGQFNYYDGGPCDKGHLRFFMYNAAKRLIESSGYRIIEEDVTYIKYGWKGIIDLIFLKMGLKTWGAFQFIFKAQKIA